jgi:hypothetical protein
MLDGCCLCRWEVQHLAADLPGERCIADFISISLAVVGCVVDGLVRILDRCEVLPRCIRLLARLLA